MDMAVVVFFLHVVYEQSAKGILVKWAEKYDWLQLSVSRTLLASSQSGIEGLISKICYYSSSGYGIGSLLLMLAIFTPLQNKVCNVIIFLFKFLKDIC